jgi:hypothetical protein
MSFLAPLYLLGGLAIALPVLLHFIRRTPRGRQPFSSLMFLSPSPPRLTRRSRIEHWLLLLLRAAVIGLLAVAFARPFLRASASLLLYRGPGKQVAILLDTSASMRRGDLWQQAIARLDQTLADLAPNDVVALYEFADEVQTVVSFPEPTESMETQASRLRKAARQLAPSWQTTNLGQALATVAESLAARERDQDEDHPAQIVLISDLQQGADLTSLQGWEWPREVLLTIAAVVREPGGNATARWLSNTAEIDLRAKVANAAGSPGEQFEIGWRSADGKLAETQSVYVPAGESRVVKMPERPAGVDRLTLVGDTDDFDNEYFVGPVHQRSFRVAFLGTDRVDDAQGLRYFLERIWAETPRRKVTIEEPPDGQPWMLVPGQKLDLVVSPGVNDSYRSTLQKYLEEGGVALLLAGTADATRQIAELLPGVVAERGETSPGDGERPPGSVTSSYALWTELDFQHPLFAAFADPRFGDFTKIRFWNRQRLSLRPEAEARVLARFDDASPALWEQPLGRGRVFVLASTWRPADSQLALSSKFVPLLSSLLNHAAGAVMGPLRDPVVGETLTLPAPSGQETWMVTTPEGTRTPLPADSPRWKFDRPGIFSFQAGDEIRVVPVNLAARESDTTPLAPDRLEQLGVRMGELPTGVERAERQRQLRDLELESRQKLWQWLIVVALVLLGIETMVAARAAQQQETLRSMAT